jgi:hypothetical protein
LYGVRDSGSGERSVPFVHALALMGPKGEVVRMRSVFDDGAMVNAIDRNVYTKVRSRLAQLSRSVRVLRMADGRLVPSIGTWTGVVDLSGVKRVGSFEVFESGGAWAVLFGKPLLQIFSAVHDYGTDIVWFPSIFSENWNVLTNQFLTNSGITGKLVGLTTDIKQRTRFWGGQCASSSEASPFCFASNSSRTG